MKIYLGVKIIEAESMDEATFINQIKNEDVTQNCLCREGYKVVYEDGYVSWSPKEVFEKAYRSIDGLTFGLAIEALKQGCKVSRAGWNGKGMFIFMRPADELSVDFIVNKVKSLPKSVKDYYSGKFSDPENDDVPVRPDSVMVKFTEYLCMKAADGTIVNGWLASQTDMLAEDWQIVE